MRDLLNALRAITTSGRGCTRLAYTDAEDRAHDLVWSALAEVDGLVRLEDAARNMFAVPREAVDDSRPIVLVGSHLDTVIEGGWLDGTLGVVAGVETVRGLAHGGRADPRVGLVVFRDEEGVRFNTGLFGSRVFAGLCTNTDLDVRDRDGVAVREVVADPAGCVDYRPPVEAAAFLECHIEQGLRLIDRNDAIGVVSGIVGIRRYRLVVEGVANHAGTTEMSRRRDALVPAAALVAGLPAHVTGMADTVITCGRLTVLPGAPNIVPGRVEAVVEIRAQTEENIVAVAARFLERVQAAGRQHGEVSVTAELIVEVAPTPTDGQLCAELVAAAGELDVPHSTLPSMAGHDTQHAAHRCPAAMFFIPSRGGISHNPAEDSDPEHIELAGRIMTVWARRIVAALPTG